MQPGAFAEHDRARRAQTRPVTGPQVAASDTFGPSPRHVLAGPFDPEPQEATVLAILTLLAFQSGTGPLYFEQQQALIPPEPAPQGGFGTRIDLDAGTLVVGAPGDSAKGFRAGAVLVYDQALGLAAPVATLYAGDPEPDASFGSGLALDGDTLAVAALNGGPSGDADVYVFERSGGVWNETQKLAGATNLTSPFSRFDLDGDTLVLGDLLVGPGGINLASVTPWERGPAGFAPTQTFAETPGTVGHLGRTVAVEGDRFVTSTGTDEVRVYERTNGFWSLAQTISGPSTGLNASFGSAIELQGDTLAVGVPLASVAGFSKAGEVYVYAHSGSAWGPPTVLTRPNPGTGQAFGKELALDGDTLVVTVGTPKGIVVVFRRDAMGSWNHESHAVALDGELQDGFGDSLALQDGRLYAGARGRDLNGIPNAGAVYAFEESDTQHFCLPGLSASGCQPRIDVSGTPSASLPSGFQLLATEVEGDKRGLFFYGTSGRKKTPWGTSSSTLCVAPPTIRTTLLSEQGTPGACDGNFAEDLNAYWQANPGKRPAAGELVQAQFWYRDPQNTSPVSTSLTDAIEFPVQP